MTALIRACFRVGYHPKAWKCARGIVLRKPGQPDYTTVKSYRVISLLNCLGKVAESIAARMISDYCEASGKLHNRQMGSLRRRSAIDAVAIAMNQIQQAWEAKNTAAILLMDVKRASDHVSKPQLLKRMTGLNIDPELARWTSSFLEDPWVRLVIDGHDLKEQSVRTGVPQGSPVSPILFTIYLSQVFAEVERKCNITAISYVDNIGLLAIGKDYDTVTKHLKKAAQTIEAWASKNAVEFDIAKTEAILFSRQNDQKYKTAMTTQRIRIGETEVTYNHAATRWLGVWIDSHLKPREHHQVWL